MGQSSGIGTVQEYIYKGIVISQGLTLSQTLTDQIQTLTDSYEGIPDFFSNRYTLTFSRPNL